MSENETKASAAQRKEKLEYEIEIAAPVEAVWKALTDATELVRWFPLEAEVKPGVGGHHSPFVRTGLRRHGPISIWEPLRRFQWKEARPGTPQGPEDVTGLAVVDWVLETRGSKTILRLVNSGFDRTNWDEEY